MSDSHEPSYYEIALTNRQVVFAFVILLVCLMGTFFSGVWVGRGETTAAPPPPERQAAADEARGVEALDFFGGGDEEGEVAGEAPPPEPRVRRQQPAGAADDRAGGEGAALPAGAPTAAPSQPPPRQEAQRQETQQQRPAAARPADGPVVQVFSSSDREQAERTLDRLQDAGQPAFLSPVEVDGQTMYRVRIGPFGDRAEAERVADDVRRRFRLDTWITQ